MKKFILFLAFVLIGTFVNAQVINGYAAFKKDSTTNSETKYAALVSPVGITGNYVTGIVIVPVNKSGAQTLKGMIQGSWDNTNFFDLLTDSITLNSAGTVKAYGWEREHSAWKYYRVKVKASLAAGVTTFTGGLVLKKD